MTRKYSHFGFLCALIAASCTLHIGCQGSGQHGSTTSSEQGGTSEDFEEEEIIYSDTVEGEKVSQDCAAMAYHLDEITERLEAVQSPSMLMKVKYDYPNLLYQATQNLDELPAEERAAVQKKLDRIQRLYAEMCENYEVEASGIICQLQNLTEKLRQVRTKADYERFVDNRHGVLNNLDKIHLSTQNDSPHIREIQKLARDLNSLMVNKKRELGIE